MQHVLDTCEPNQRAEVFHEDDAWAVGGEGGVGATGCEKPPGRKWIHNNYAYPMRLNNCMTTSRGIFEETERGV